MQSSLASKFTKKRSYKCLFRTATPFWTVENLCHGMLHPLPAFQNSRFYKLSLLGYTAFRHKVIFSLHKLWNTLFQTENSGKCTPEMNLVHWTDVENVKRCVGNWKLSTTHNFTLVKVNVIHIDFQWFANPEIVSATNVMSLQAWQFIVCVKSKHVHNVPAMFLIPSLWLLKF